MDGDINRVLTRSIQEDTSLPLLLSLVLPWVPCAVYMQTNLICVE